MREFLARNQVPYEWLDADAAERVPEVRRLLEAFDGRTPKLPTVIFPEGERLEEPAPFDVAARLGLRTRAGLEFYDVAIVGGGPAGLAAAVYGASEGLKTVMIEREAPGGQAGLSSRIENYLGFPSGLSGSVFARRAVDQARASALWFHPRSQFHSDQRSVSFRSPQRWRGAILPCADTGDGSSMAQTWHSWQRAFARRRRVLWLVTSTEGISCRDEDVYLVGGANSAGQAAMFFAKFARRVVMLVRGPSLAATCAIPYRSNRANRKHSRGTAISRSRSAWRGSSRSHYDRLRCFR